MGEDEYTRLNGMLNAVAERQKTFADNMLKARMRFVVTEKAIEKLLKTIMERRRNR